MRRIVGIIAVVTVSVLAYFIYQYKVQQQELVELKDYQQTIQNKGAEIYIAAQDWQKPIQLDLSTLELQDDYKIMATFMLNFIAETAEIRNSYVRELKQAKWDKFLDVKRLENDKKHHYAETEHMFLNVKNSMNNYQKTLQQHDRMAEEGVKKLPVKPRFRRYLAESFQQISEQNDKQELFQLEQQSYNKASQLFGLLKTQKWVTKNNMFYFEDEAVIKQFNQTYQEMLDLDQKMRNIEHKNQQAIEQKIELEASSVS